VIRLDPNHEKARHRLGFKRVGRVWATDAQVSTSRAETEAQERANRKYRPTFERWAAGLNDSEGTKRSEAQSRFLEISDPRAIPELKRVLGRDDPRRLRMLAATLGQIDSPWAARTLVEMALGGNDSEARRMAVETLRQRDYREFIDRLIGLVRKPLTYDVRFVGGPGTTGVLYVEGEEYNLRKRYEIGITNLPRPRIGQLAPGEAVVFDESGTPHAIRPQGGIAVTEDLARSVGFSRGSSYIDNLTAALYLSQALAGQSAESWLFSGTGGYGFVGELGGAPPRTVARPLVTPPELSPEIARRVAVAEQGIRNVQAQQAADIAEIDALNQDIQATNDRVLPILTSITGLELGAEPRQWQDWYFDQIGVSSHRPSEKPTIDQVVRYQPPRLSSSCFGAGTLVQTKLGPRAIETLAVGDLVLSQDPQAGSIEYQPVLAVYHNPPSKTFRVKLDSGETIVSSTFHRFWVANRGWVMAKDLHEGDTLRTLGGRTKVVSIEPGEVMPVYNLDVSRTRSFFVGKSIALVHDHSIPSGSTPNPFDALGGLASASGGARTRTRSD
jgi:hypothetical protein